MIVILQKMTGPAVAIISAAQWLLNIHVARVFVAVEILKVVAADFRARNSAKSCPGARNDPSRRGGCLELS